MKVLWIVNIVMPRLCEHLDIPVAAGGSWLVDIADCLEKDEDIQLAVACVYGDKFRKITLKNTTYYMLPGGSKDMFFYRKKFEKMWQDICNDFSPDIVHIHGTEYAHGLSFMRACGNVPAVISIQGIMDKFKDCDFAGIPFRNFLFGRTLRQWTHFNGEIESHILHKQNARFEKEMFSRAVATNGTGVWDTSVAKRLNPNIKIYTIDYNLRDNYYKSEKWDIEKVERHTIFANPANIPRKGFHKLIMAAALIKNKYPDIKIKAPGLTGKDGNVIISSAYTRYLFRLIEKTGMKNHIEFLGKQTAEQMAQNALSANVTVIPSAIENAPLVLREAMFLGCPCIASFSGCIGEYVLNGENGFLYNFSDYEVLAALIEKLFDDDELCKKISAAAIEKSAKVHKRDANPAAYKDMYKEILADSKGM